MKNIYQHFSKPGLLSSNYTLKFLFIAFIGVHIPLIVLIFAIVFKWIPLSGWNVILVALVATLLATGLTLILLKSLLWPIHQAKNALKQYSLKKIVPSLPMNYTDEAGQLMQQVQISIDSIDALLKDRKDMLTLLSHDLRTPLSQISGIGDLLQTETNNAKIVEYGSLIKKLAHEQLAFIKDIIQLLETGSENEMSYVFEANSIETILSKALEMQQLAAGRKNISIQLHPLPEVKVKSNLRLLSQAISNIIGNAIKFSQRSDEIIIKLHVFSGHIHILVADKGIGFEPGKAEMLFQKFTSEGKSGTEGEISSGVGLYLTRKIIQNHNGMIAAFSEGINKGAVFTIQLPIA
ncbi:MAG: sensor histidine kinase [Sediminibacterium sp.]